MLAASINMKIFSTLLLLSSTFAHEHSPITDAERSAVSAVIADKALDFVDHHKVDLH